MNILPYKDKETSKREQVAEMFDNISNKYDLLNHVLSGGIDIYWRKKAIKLLKNKKPKLILDIATGTGDFAIEALKLNPDKVIGVDISEGMLAVGREKIKKIKKEHLITLQTGDSESLSFPDNYFDAVIVWCTELSKFNNGAFRHEPRNETRWNMCYRRVLKTTIVSR